MLTNMFNHCAKKLARKSRVASIMNFEQKQLITIAFITSHPFTVGLFGSSIIET